MIVEDEWEEDRLSSIDDSLGIIARAVTDLVRVMNRLAEAHRKLVTGDETPE